MKNNRCGNPSEALGVEHVTLATSLSASSPHPCPVTALWRGQSLFPREARVGREPERGAVTTENPPLPDPLLPPASGREGENAGPPPVVTGRHARTKSRGFSSPLGVERVPEGRERSRFQGSMRLLELGGGFSPAASASDDLGAQINGHVRELSTTSYQ